MEFYEFKILDAIQQMRFPFLDKFMIFASYLGDWGIFYTVLTLLLLVIKKTRKAGYVCALAILTDFLAVNVIIKPLVARVRPYLVNQAIVLLVRPPVEYSFPSGHTAVSFAFATAIALQYKKWGAAAYLTASLTAFSRLYLYLHYPTDVIGGIIIGIACGLLAKYLWERRISKLMLKK